MINPARIRKSAWIIGEHRDALQNGGCKINGDFYVIDPATKDLVKQLPKARKRNTNTKQTHHNATTQN